MKILLTGHRGYIGAVAAPLLQAAGHEVTGLSHSRAGHGLIQLDLTKQDEVGKLFEGIQPNCLLPLYLAAFVMTSGLSPSLGVIHCAAERRPDVAEKVCISHVFVHAISEIQLQGHRWNKEGMPAAIRCSVLTLLVF